MTGFFAGAISGLFSALLAYDLLQFDFAGNSITKLSVLTMIIGGLLGLLTAFIVSKMFREKKESGERTEKPYTQHKNQRKC